MTETKPQSAAEPHPRRKANNRVPWWVVAFLVAGILVLATAYHTLRDPTVVHHIEWHEKLGTALGPVTSVLSLFAIVAALWSVELQRRTLAGQQTEIDRHMALLQEQALQFTRSAQAQEDLAAAEKDVANAQQRANALAEVALDVQNEAIVVARRAADLQKSLTKSQERLALAQEEANEQSVRMEHAMRTGTTAALKAALVDAYRLANNVIYTGKAPELVTELVANIKAEQSVIDERGDKIFNTANERLMKEGTHLG